VNGVITASTPSLEDVAIPLSSVLSSNILIDRPKILLSLEGTHHRLFSCSTCTTGILGRTTDLLLQSGVPLLNRFFQNRSGGFFG
jgi:hypothetical protein